MSVLVTTLATAPISEATRAWRAQDSYPPHPLLDVWESTRRTRQEILDDLSAMPLVGTRADTRSPTRVLSAWFSARNPVTSSRSAAFFSSSTVNFCVSTENCSPSTETNSASSE
jgi:hypothetical protein